MYYLYAYYTVECGIKQLNWIESTDSDTSSAHWQYGDILLAIYFLSLLITFYCLWKINILYYTTIRPSAVDVFLHPPTLAEDGELDAEVTQREQSGWKNWKRVSAVLCDRRMNVKIKGEGVQNSGKTSTDVRDIDMGVEEGTGK